MTDKKQEVEAELLQETAAEPVTAGDVDFEAIASEVEDDVSSPSDYQINTYPADFTLEVLLHKWKNGDILIPSFQRKFVWKLSQASKLIESFLVGLPVPAIFFYTDRASQKFFVVDGQQRLRSVFYFFEGYFGEEKKGKRQIFQLTGLGAKSRFYGRTYAELPEQDQTRLKNSVLRAFIVQQLDPTDDTSIYHIFERLNTGGTLLTNQEVRNCVYHGSFNELLANLNSRPEWRAILGRPTLDSRYKDAELILRFFSLLTLDGYEKPMKDHLSRYMRRNASTTGAAADEMRKLFATTCARVVESLGAKPFHVRAGLNAAVYDSVMVAFAKSTGAVPADIQARYKSLLANEKFASATRQATTDSESVKLRFQLANQVLFG
jgi:hypothetical protein